MKKKAIPQLLLVVLSIMLTTGCSTLPDARNAKGKGRSPVYDASLDTVWEKTKVAVADTGLEIASENREEGYILAQKGISAFSYGENVAVFVDKVDESTTRVEVVSKKALVTNLFAANWEKPILDRVSELLSKE